MEKEPKKLYDFMFMVMYISAPLVFVYPFLAPNVTVFIVGQLIIGATFLSSLIYCATAKY